MKLLLDTHTFLWWLSTPEQLAESAASAIANRANDVQVSLITLWEIAIKRAIGKLQAPIDLQVDVVRAGFQILPITVDHIVATERLPLHHRDPFDRMLLAQAQLEGATLVSRDPRSRRGAVPGGTVVVTVPQRARERHVRIRSHLAGASRAICDRACLTAWSRHRACQA